MRKEVKHLYELGFAIHWLKARDKMPVKSGWTKGPRSTRAELNAEYRDGLNVGVRLGQVSEIDGAFLAVIDCDVKSEDPKYLFEMQRELERLFPNYENFPAVMSGRGNGSVHLYVRTNKPARPKLLARSADRVFVTMKGKTVTRAAWEISFMGEGQQVVLPPSIHPDSGRPYLWIRPITAASDIPVIVNEVVSDAVKDESVAAFVPVEVDVNRLPEATRNLIVEGVGCDGDKSLSLSLAAGAMVKAGFTDQEIASVLTIKEHYLGEVAYAHAKTDSVARAARWLLRYPIKWARSNFSDARSDFADDTDLPLLSDEAAHAQYNDLVASVHWSLQIERGDLRQGGKPKNTLKNVILILDNAVSEHLFSFDEFALKSTYGADAPWGAKKGKEVDDYDIVAIKVFIANHFRFEPSSDRIKEAITEIAHRNKVHPIKDYLDRLVWDGKPRIDKWLETYANVREAPAYAGTLGRKTLCAMVARIYQPGIKFDHVLVLEGKEDLKKSTLLSALSGEEYFTDQEFDLRNKDSIALIQGKWLVEMGELATLDTHDMRSLKAFVSRTVDRARPAFGVFTRDFPRQTIFIGTTNDYDYLKSPTGSRRFWPVRVGECNPDALRRDRDQLWAEARALWKAGETLYIADQAIKDLAREAQMARAPHDPMFERTVAYFDRIRNKVEGAPDFPLEGFTMHEAMSAFGPFDGLKDSEAYKAGHVLRKMGYDNRNLMIKGVQKRRWVLEKGVDSKMV